MADLHQRARRVALVTYAELPGLTDDDRLLAEALTERGADVEAAVWSDHGIDWPSFDAVVVRSCWDYFHRPDEFLRWLSRLEAEGAHVLNPAPLLRWNARKTYLRDLESRGIAVVPTHWLARGEASSLAATRRDAGWSELVIKPAISGSAFDTWRSSPGDEARDDLRLAAMTARGDVLVQPLLDEIASDGEWSLVFVDGVYSHAVLKRTREGDFRVQIEHGGTFAATEPPRDVIDQSAAALRAAPLDDSPALYARVDGCVVDGRLMLMELELIEPVLFLGVSAAAARRLAAAILSRADQRAALTRQIVLPTSSATSSAPRESMATPTGRPLALPSSSRKAVSTSIGTPDGLPPVKGTKTTR
jgi:glutathione synthase/RimK-type ligase-like ATP-grasp enzyme